MSALHFDIPHNLVNCTVQIFIRTTLNDFLSDNLIDAS